MSTRNYISNFNAVNISLQTDDQYCVFYALNNLIQTSPFLKHKPLITLQDFQRYKNELCKQSSTNLRIHLKCLGRYKHFTHLIMYAGLVPSLIFIALPQTYNNYELAVPKPYDMQRNESFARVFIGKHKLNNKYDYYRKTITKLPEYNHNIVVGTILEIYDKHVYHGITHAITIVPIYPYNAHGINKYIFMDSTNQEFDILDEKYILQILENYNIVQIIRVYLR